MWFQGIKLVQLRQRFTHTSHLFASTGDPNPDPSFFSLGNLHGGDHATDAWINYSSGHLSGVSPPVRVEDWW